MIEKKIAKSVEILLVLFFLAATVFTSWKIFGRYYLFSAGRPCGGDYFNALTYAKFFRENFTWPTLGWLPFWHEGMPEIGGYSWLSFTLMQPLQRFFSVEWSMEIFSVSTLILFFMASYLLFWEITADIPVSFCLVIILLFTRSAYNPLMAGAFIVSSTMQFLLPLTLFALFRFLKGKGQYWLIMAAFFAGVALLWHAPVGLITVFAPALVISFFWPQAFGKKITNLIIFTLLAVPLGSMGIYTMAIQALLGQGHDRCASIECWGAYPRHFWWFNSLATALLLAGLVLVLVLKFINRKIEIKKVVAVLAGLGVIVLYAVLAKLKMIDSLVNTIFPTRIFWAAGLLILVVVGECWDQIKFFLGKARWAGSIAISILLTILIFLWVKNSQWKSNQICDVNNANPQNIETLITEKYQKKDWHWQSIIPDWLPIEDTNWRLDSLNHKYFHWFNFLAKMSSVRGYSNYPTGKHRDWLYWLQAVEMKNQDEIDRNSAKFLFDAFGIGYLQGLEYDSALTSDQTLISRYEAKGGFFYYQLNPEITSPIVTGSQAPVLLFIGDESAYGSFTRSLAMDNLSSRHLIVVKGGLDLNGFNQDQLKKFDAVFLYGYQSKKINWPGLADYVRQGGQVLLETGDFVNESDSLQGGYDKVSLPEVFPVEETKTEVLGKNWDGLLELEKEEIKLADFSPLSEDGRDWKLSTALKTREWATPILINRGKVIIALGKLGQGKVIWSGLNLPFHLMSYRNAIEGKFLASLLGKLVDISDKKLPEFKYERIKPGKIIVSGKDLKGIFFKENYDTGWKAKTSQGKSLKIYPAGLDFMYAVLPKVTGEIQVEFSYQGTLTNWLLLIITGISLLLMILLAISPKVLSQPLRKISGRIKRKIKTSWENEE